MRGKSHLSTMFIEFIPLSLVYNLHAHQNAHTVFTWLNAVATISHIVKLDVATIQGQQLFKSNVYYTEAPSVELLINYYI